MLSDTFVDTKHDVWNVFPYSEELVCIQCHIGIFKLFGHNSAPTVAMLVLSCMLSMYFFCSACRRRSFTACGLCEFIRSFPSMSLRIVFLKSHVKLCYAAYLFASLNRESLFLLIFSISWALTTCSLMSFPWLM